MKELKNGEAACKDEVTGEMMKNGDELVILCNTVSIGSVPENLKLLYCSITFR